MNFNEPKIYKIVVGAEGPDGPVLVYDIDDVEEPCVFHAANADEAERWCDAQNSERGVDHFTYDDEVSA